MSQQKGVVPRDEFVYYYDANNLKGIRKGQWKLVFPAVSQTYKKSLMGADGFPSRRLSDTVRLALYDLRKDPGETLDVKAQHQDIVERLTRIADTYREELGDDLTNRKGTGVRPPARVTIP